VKLINTNRYDAFISYSRRDGYFAKKLESKLEWYRVPRGTKGHGGKDLQRRRLNIFRDEQDLIGNDLPEAINDGIGVGPRYHTDIY
jgi:hypothetical protein